MAWFPAAQLMKIRPERLSIAALLILVFASALNTALALEQSAPSTIPVSRETLPQKQATSETAASMQSSVLPQKLAASEVAASMQSSVSSASVQSSVPPQKLAATDSSTSALAPIKSQTRQLASAMPTPLTDVGPGVRLSASAQEVAHDLGIFDAVEEMLSAERTNGQESVAVISHRQRLLETILTASFEIRSAISRIDDEISHANEIRDIMEDRREKKVQQANILAFVNSGTAAMLSTAFTNFPKGNVARSGGPLSDAAGVIGVAGGALEIGISTLSLKLAKGERSSGPAYPNMLAPLFGYKGSDARFPEGVWDYLTGPYPHSIAPKETRRSHLLSSWVHLGRLYSAKTKIGEHQIGLVTGLAPQNKEVTIDLLEDRALMLSDLRAAISQMDVEMLEILRWVKTF
jgi:hypothetical protein